jgi:hypothetical protein
MTVPRLSIVELKRGMDNTLPQHIVDVAPVSSVARE